MHLVSFLKNIFRLNCIYFDARYRILDQTLVVLASRIKIFITSSRTIMGAIASILQQRNVLFVHAPRSITACPRDGHDAKKKQKNPQTDQLSDIEYVE